jgi:hypothetical protein
VERASERLIERLTARTSHLRGLGESQRHIFHTTFADAGGFPPFVWSDQNIGRARNLNTPARKPLHQDCMKEVFHGDVRATVAVVGLRIVDPPAQKPRFKTWERLALHCT